MEAWARKNKKILAILMAVVALAITIPSIVYGLSSFLEQVD
jgi:hypothetical protein